MYRPLDTQPLNAHSMIVTSGDEFGQYSDRNGPVPTNKEDESSVSLKKGKSGQIAVNSGP